MRVEIALAAAELRHRPALWLLLALGTCLAGLLPVYAAGLAGDASRAATTAAVDALPPSERAVLAVTTRLLDDADVSQVDQQVRTAFAAVGVQDPSRSLTFRPLALAGQDVTVAALSPLPSSVRLTGGRLPDSCRPTSCEVLAVAPETAGGSAVTPAAQSAARALGLVVTGTAVLTDSRLTGLGLAEPGSPLLLAAAPDQLARLSALELFGRNTAWYGSVDGTAIAARGVRPVSQALGGLPAAVGDAGPLSVGWPEATVSAAADRAAQASARLRALGTGSGLLVLGFCVVVAAALRPRTQHLARVLTRRGARSSQVFGVLVLQAASVVVVGVLLGAGAAVLWLGGRLAGAAPWSAALAASGSCWPTLALLAAAAVLLTVLVTRWPPDASPLATWSLAAALLVTVGLPVLVLTSSTPTAGSLPTQLVMSLVLATGLLTALVWRPLVGLSEGRRSPDGPPTDTQSAAVRRVALLGARRRPLLPMAAAALLAAGCCFAVFTAGYRQSLDSSAADQAAAAVPLDVRVDGTGAVLPLDAVDVAALQAVSPQVAVHPVVSSPVTVFAGTEHAVALPLTGVDLEALPAVNRFAATTGASVSAAELATRLTPVAASSADGPVLPAGARRVSLTAAGWNDDTTVNLWTSRPDGQEERVPLRHAGSRLVGRLPAGPDRQVRAVEVAESSSHLTHRQHAVGEGTTDQPLAGGRLRLTAVTVDAAPVAWSWAGWGSDGADVRAAAGRLDVTYRLSGKRIILGPGYRPPTARPPVPVAVDPATAATVGAAGLFPLTVSGQPVPARVVAVLPRLPGVDGRFVLAERGQVADLLDRYAPGTAAVTQLWVAAPAEVLPAVRTALAPAANAGAHLAYRVDLAAAIAADPVSSRTTAFFTVVSVATLLLALVALLAAVRADLETSAADQLALELDGVPPSGLRQVLRTRAALLLTGLPVGVLGGLVVVRVAVRVLTLGPGGVAVEPPLRVVLPLLPALAAGAGGLLVAGLVVGGLTAGAYRRPPTHDDRRSAPVTGTLVEVDDAFVAYRGDAGQVMALRGADLRLEAGERLLVQGPNGSGKSTLLRVVTGEQSVAAGSVRVAGTDLTTMSTSDRRRWRARAVGVVDQHAHRSLLPELSVVDNVGLQLWTTGTARRQARQRAEEVLAELGLDELVGRPVAELSGGEAQRVSICAAVAHRPRLVLADEPTGALDAAGARAVYDLLTAVAATGTGVVLVSHDPGTIAFADRAVRIRHGRTAEQWYPGSAAEEQLPDSRGWVRVPAELLASGAARGYVAATLGDDLLLRPVAGPTVTAPATEPPSLSRPRTTRPQRDALVLAGVGVRFGSRTLFADLDLILGAGDWAVVDGPSGSGKSTLLALVAGLTDPTSGTVSVGGSAWGDRERPARAELRRDCVGYAPQRGSLLETLTVRENLEVSATVRGQPADRPRVDGMVEALGLTTLLDRRATYLSGGEWQRASLARCLLADAPLLVLDEPTSQQDDASAAAVLAVVLDELAAGRSLLVAAHDPRFVARAPRTIRLGR